MPQSATAPPCDLWKKNNTPRECRESQGCRSDGSWFIFCLTNDSFDKLALLRRRLVVNSIRLPQPSQRLFQVCAVIVMHYRDGLPCPHRVSRFLVQNQANRVI